MESFFTFFEKRVDDCSSLLCIGLDPHGSDLPSPTAASALDFCLRIVKATAPYAAAFKPNAAFFEVFGPEGWTALKQVIEAVQEESDRRGSMIPVILDAKRGDIASTAEAYARSAFEQLGAHAITLNPYLGKTRSSRSSRIQRKGCSCCAKRPTGVNGLAKSIGASRSTQKVQSRLVQFFISTSLTLPKWNTRNNIGLVVGATQPEALSNIRAAAPDLWFLAPGIGAQGGDLETALKSGLRKDGKGMLINVSRSIARTENPGLAAAEMRDEIINIKRDLKI
jgi:orotidine 5'-phosphate decarboxylase subfamily 2